MDWLKKNWGWLLIVLIGLVPLAEILKMIHLDFSGAGNSWFVMDSFTMRGRAHGGVPEVLTGAHIAVKITGEWAIRWIVAVLCLTPFTILTGIKSRLHVRQAMGITAFVYAALHFLFFCIDKGWMETFREFGFVLGLVATLVMMVLAVTSNRRSLKLLRRTWKRIHRLAYLAGILAVVHVALLEHGDWFPYALLLVVGFTLRLPAVKAWIAQIRNRREMVRETN